MDTQRTPTAQSTPETLEIADSLRFHFFLHWLWIFLDVTWCQSVASHFPEPDLRERQASIERQEKICGSQVSGNKSDVPNNIYQHPLEPRQMRWNLTRHFLLHQCEAHGRGTQDKDAPGTVGQKGQLAGWDPEMPPRASALTHGRVFKVSFRFPFCRQGPANLEGTYAFMCASRFDFQQSCHGNHGRETSARFIKLCIIYYWDVKSRATVFFSHLFSHRALEWKHLLLHRLSEATAGDTDGAGHVTTALIIHPVHSLHNAKYKDHFWIPQWNKCSGFKFNVFTGVCLSVVSTGAFRGWRLTVGYNNEKHFNSSCLSKLIGKEKAAARGLSRGYAFYGGSLWIIGFFFPFGHTNNSAVLLI